MWGYIVAAPVLALSPGEAWLKVVLYVLAAPILLGVAALTRRHARSQGRVYPSTSESFRNSLAQVPKLREGDSWVGIVASGQFKECHFLVLITGGKTVELLIVSRHWPHRAKYARSFSSSAEWRAWAHQNDLRFIGAGKYSDSALSSYFKTALGAIPDITQPQG